MFNRHFDPYNILLDAETKTVVVLNPKVLTTFLRACYRDGCHAFRTGRDISDGRYRWYPRARSFPVPSIRQFWQLNRGAPDHAIYGLVRNPYRRVLSGWRDKFLDPHVAGGGETKAYPRSMRRGELARFRRLAKNMGLPGGEEGELVPFHSFLAIIAAQTEGRRNHHWDKQVVVMQCQHFDFTRIFRLEDERDEALTAIFGRMGFAEDWIRQRAAKPKNQSAGGKGFYSNQMAALVADVFRDDFARFGYDTACPDDLISGNDTPIMSDP